MEVRVTEDLYSPPLPEGQGHVLAGVRAHFCAAHRKPGGSWHGHTWTVIAWWPAGPSAEQLQDRLRNCLAKYDDDTLPPELFSGEAIAADIAQRLANVVQIDVIREAEGIYARWVA